MDSRVLAGYWLLFALYPLPNAGSPNAAGGVAAPGADGPTGFLTHWAKDTNPAAAFDRVFLTLFPRPAGSPFRSNEGGYATLNFVPTIVTMLAGGRLRSGAGPVARVRSLVLAGSACLVVGIAPDQTVCPIVKRIWAPSWVVYSTGWTCLRLALFHGLFDVAGFRRWAFPMAVVGVNSIAFYMMAQLMKPFVAGQFQIHLGRTILDGDYGPTLRSASVLLVFWLIAYGRDRQRIFVRI